MSKNQKPILNTSGQIEHLRSKGIKFEKMSTDDAMIYLDKNNNYFKLRAYRKNFDKHPDGPKIGQYINLDFGMLKDLSIIDMRLRYAFIHMALDVEHFAKVKLLKAIEATGEDGYQIVTDYIDKLKSENDGNRYNILINEISRNRDNPYCGGIIKHYEFDYPAWAFIEVVPFGRFIQFYKFCAERLGQKAMINDYYLFNDIRELRNASAHSNCLINDLGANDSQKRLNYAVSKTIPIKLIGKDTRNRKMGNERMRQITTLLYTHSVIVTSKDVHEYNSTVLHNITQRMFRNIEFYEGNDLIISNFSFLRKIIDNFF